MPAVPKFVTVFDTETTGTGRDALVVSFGSVTLDLSTDHITDRFEIFVDPRLDAGSVWPSRLSES